MLEFSNKFILVFSDLFRKIRECLCILWYLKKMDLHIVAITKQRE